MLPATPDLVPMGEDGESTTGCLSPFYPSLHDLIGAPHRVHNDPESLLMPL